MANTNAIVSNVYFFYLASYYFLGFLSTELTPCMTNKKLNVNSINGSIALTVLKENFFDGEYTSGTIVSKKSFNLTQFGTKLIIEFRAAFRTDLGIYPQILLMPDNTLESTDN